MGLIFYAMHFGCDEWMRMLGHIGFAFLFRDSANYASMLALAAPSIRFHS